MGKQKPKADQAEQSEQPIITSDSEQQIIADENQDQMSGSDEVIDAGGTEPEPTPEPEPEPEAELDLNDRNEYTIILLQNLPPLKTDDEKIVSGNVAKALIKKGIAKLK